MLDLLEVPSAENFPEGDAFVTREPDFDASSVNHDRQKLWERDTPPW
jgi:hypothetical protein